MKSRTLLLSLLLTCNAFGTDYNSLRDQALAQCLQFDPGEFETGLFFNPDGYRSYYKRSACLQGVAVDFRELTLCEQVRRRFALFSSSWGYSSNNCRTLVDTKIAEDRNDLEQLRRQYLAGPVRLLSVSMEQNGNGRDYDFIPHLVDGFSHGYRMEFLLRDESDESHSILEHSGYYSGSSNNLRLYLPRGELLNRFPLLEPDKPYQLEVRLTLSIGIGGVGGWQSPEFIESIFPESERSESVLVTVTF